MDICIILLSVYHNTTHGYVQCVQCTTVLLDDTIPDLTMPRGNSPRHSYCCDNVCDSM